jgi:hypothetical protein
MEFFLLKYFALASPRFLEDSVLRHDSSVLPRAPDLLAEEVGGYLHATIVHKQKITKQTYGAKGYVDRLILMDGSGGLFPAQINTGIIQMDDAFLQKGGTIHIRHWSWIWLQRPKQVQFIARGLLLIHEFEWSAPPFTTDTYCESPHEILVLPHRVIHEVQDNQHLLWIVKRHITLPNGRLAACGFPMGDRDIRNGFFIPLEKERKAYIELTKEEDLDDVDYMSSSPHLASCTCQNRFGLAECYKQQLPVDFVYRFYHHTVFKKALRKTNREDWSVMVGGYQTSEQSSLMYEWFHRNVFSIAAPEFTENGFPLCFQEDMRDLLSDTDQYGFCRPITSTTKYPADSHTDYDYHQEQEIVKPSDLDIKRGMDINSYQVLLPTDICPMYVEDPFKIFQSAYTDANGNVFWDNLVCLGTKSKPCLVCPNKKMPSIQNSANSNKVYSPNVNNHEACYMDECTGTLSNPCSVCSPKPSTPLDSCYHRVDHGIWTPNRVDDKPTAFVMEEERTVSGRTSGTATAMDEDAFAISFCQRWKESRENLKRKRIEELGKVNSEGSGAASNTQISALRELLLLASKNTSSILAELKVLGDQQQRLDDGNGPAMAHFQKWRENLVAELSKTRDRKLQYERALRALVRASLSIPIGSVDNVHFFSLNNT